MIDVEIYRTVECDYLRPLSERGHAVYKHYFEAKERPGTCATCEHCERHGLTYLIVWEVDLSGVSVDVPLSERGFGT